MPVTQYYPDGDAELVKWFETFARKLRTHADDLDVSDDELDSVDDDAELLRWSVTEVTLYTAELRERVAFKESVKHGRDGAATTTFPTPPSGKMLAEPPVPGVLPRLRALVRRIKAHPRYNPATGVDLGIVAPTRVLPDGKPTGSVTAESGSVVLIRFRKNGYPAVFIESKRDGELVWENVGIAIRSPYRDTRPPLVPNKPEMREYRLRYVRANTPVGEVSNVLSVTTVL